MAFPKDRLPLKITVYTAFLLETAQTSLITHDAFKFFAIGFTDPLLLDEVTTGWFSIPIMTGISESCPSFNPSFNEWEARGERC